MTTINMQTMRYINLLDRASKVRTRRCFVYNNTVFFAVPNELVSKAIGPNALNVKRIQEDLGRKIRIIIEPDGLKDISKFIGNVVSPNKFKSLEVENGVAIVTAGNNQSKASLIGRNKRRFEELKLIVKDTFGLDLRIL